MAGIYLHIPYCRQACSYCDFYFSTSLSSKNELLEALLTEAEWRKSEVREPVDTVYFGGGTPSLLSGAELERILHHLQQHYAIDAGAEITLEANPDNLDETYLEDIKKAGVNRLSIGLQSFNDDELLQLKRIHSAGQNTQVVQRAQQAGFDNLSVDLIYGTPWLSHERWQQHLQTVVDMKVQHISCYQLTIEERTELHHRVKKGLLEPAAEEHTEQQFLMLIDALKKAGFVHYEVSNFGLPGYFSRHNTAYWKDIPYVGLGPSAHGYDGRDRYANVANLHQYIRQVKKREPWYTVETRNQKNSYNDLVLTGLRTIFGVDLRHIEKKLSQSFANYFQRKAQPYLQNGQMIKNGYVYTLKEEAFLLADGISADLFWV